MNPPMRRGGNSFNGIFMIHSDRKSWWLTKGLPGGTRHHNLFNYGKFASVTFVKRYC